MCPDWLITYITDFGDILIESGYLFEGVDWLNVSVKLYHKGKWF